LSEIIITVSPTAEVRLETRGFTGSACRAASRSLEQALGVVQRETLTSEFHTAQPELRQREVT
jgi:hypothetical protein